MGRALGRAPQVPTNDQVASVTADLARRAALPEHLPAVLGALHKDTHPMIQFSTAVLALQARPRAAVPGPAAPPLARLRAMPALLHGCRRAGGFQDWFPNPNIFPVAR